MGAVWLVLLLPVSYLTTIAKSFLSSKIVSKTRSNTVVVFHRAGTRMVYSQAAGTSWRDSSQAHSARIARTYSTLPAEFARTTLESTAVSDVAGKCEQKPMPT